MREELLDLLERLVSLRHELGDEAFARACHRSRLAIATVAMDTAEKRVDGLNGTDRPRNVPFTIRE